MTVYIDAHTHLDMMVGDWETAVSQHTTHRIFALSVSIDVAGYEHAQQLAADHPFMVPLFGIHPWEAEKISADFSQLDPFIAETPILGEIGLDFHFFKEKQAQERQRQLFSYFLDAAERQQKLVNLHTLAAEKEVLRGLEARDLPGAIVHWYAGPTALIERYLAAGAYFSIGVGVLFDRHIADIVTAVPADRLLSETDNPDAYNLFRKKPGYPALLLDVVSRIGELRGWSEAETTSRIAANFTRLLAAAPEALSRWQGFQLNRAA